MDGPAPGSYETSEAIAKTQWRGIESAPKRTSKNLNFTDIYKNKYKYIPGPGAFKHVDNHATVLHKDKGITNKARGLAI